MRTLVFLVTFLCLICVTLGRISDQALTNAFTNDGYRIIKCARAFYRANR